MIIRYNQVVIKGQELKILAGISEYIISNSKCNILINIFWVCDMTKLEDLQPNTALWSILSDCLVKAINIQWFGSEVLDLNYKTFEGNPANEFHYHHNETGIKVGEQGRTWSLNEDGSAFTFVSKTHLICLERVFDSILAVRTSMFYLLPHQITVVYNLILFRQLLNYWMAANPKTNKMIIFSLLIQYVVMQSFFNIARVV